MKGSAVVIQSAYRGWVVRRKYSKVRKGVVALQAVYRMKKQQNIYGEMKSELQRRKEIHQVISLFDICGSQEKPHCCTFS